MGTTSNSSNFSITDVLAEVGLNILEEDDDATLDTECDRNTEKSNNFNLFSVSDKENDCDIKEYTKLHSSCETNKRVDVSEETDNGGEQEPTNCGKRVLKINENNTEISQPVHKKLKLSEATPNEEKNVHGKSKLNCLWQTTGCSSDVLQTGCSSNKSRMVSGGELPSTLEGISPDEVYTEKNFGLRIKNPLVTLSMLTAKMSGKQAIQMDRIKSFILKGEFEENNDWVIAGVIVKKYATTSQTGKQYCSWTLSNLKESILTVTVLLFSNAFKELWKSTVGTVVGILNPNVMESRSQYDGEATFSVRSSDQIMLWGQSSDFGICESRKNNGEKCTMFVNKRLCNYCIYHAQKEYKKFCSGRSELQKPTEANLRRMFARKMGWNLVACAGIGERALIQRGKNLKERDRNLLALLNEIPRSKCNKVQQNIAETDRSFEIKPKTKLQEMLLASALPSASAPNRISETVSFHCKNLELGINNKMTAKTLTPTCTVTNTTNETCNRTVDNKTHFEKLSQIDSVDKKTQNIRTGNKNFDFKACIDKVMGSKIAKNVYTFNEKEFNLFLDSNNSHVDERDNPNRDTGANSGLVPLANQNKTGQTEICKRVTNRLKNKIQSLNNPKSDISAKFDQHNFLRKEPSKNEYNEKTIQSRETLNNKKKSFTQDTCNQLTAEIQSEMFTRMHQSLISPKASDPQISHGNHSRSMIEALKYVREHGPIQKNRKSSEIKWLISESQEECTSKGVEEFKTIAVISDKFKELMNTESAHTQLAESTAMEEYYNKMEQKEKIEEKLLNTYKVECKIVMCKVCKYKAGSASEFCKQNNHPLVCVKGYKRFFKCSNCSKRTVVYDIFPYYNCVHCNSSSWIRVPVIEVKTVASDLNQLSLRGDEQKFISSHENSANINLLVPED